MSNLLNITDSIKKEKTEFTNELKALAKDIIFLKEPNASMDARGNLVVLYAEIMLNHLVNMKITREYGEYSNSVRQTVTYSIDETRSYPMAEKDAHKDLVEMVDFLSKYVSYYNYKYKLNGGKQNLGLSD